MVSYQCGDLVEQIGSPPTIAPTTSTNSKKPDEIPSPLPLSSPGVSRPCFSTVQGVVYFADISRGAAVGGNDEGRRDNGFLGTITTIPGARERVNERRPERCH